MYDFIIIGAGSAGCATANYLVRAGKTVLMLEAGGHDRSPFIKIPAGAWRVRSKHDWGYHAEPDPSRGRVVDHWHKGRVLGGTSSINGTVYVRGAAGDYDRWSTLCNHQGGWAARDVLPIFRELENSDQGGCLRGKDGPLWIRTVKHPHPVTEAFIQSAVESGVPYNEDYNGPSQEGVGYMQLTQHRGIRCSAADAFLTPLRRKTNFTVCLKAFVERVEFEGKRAVAVVYRRNGKTHRAAGRGIVLSAGAINSPKLLMLSGIGSEAELSHHGIQTLVNLPGVGRNLREHPFISITCRSKVATNNLTQGMIQKLSIGAKFAFRREGPIANAYEAMAFLKLDPNAAIPEFQIFFAPIAWERIGQQLQLTPYPGFQVTIVRSHSVSNGHVRLSSKDPVAPPVIELALLDSDSDVDALASGISAVRNILGTGPIAELLAEEISPGTLIRSARALKDHIRTRAGTACHPMGTCRMGLGKDAVVDPDLKVHGTDNLWVADASIMPDQISANHNAPCMMIGAKLGKQLSRMI